MSELKECPWCKSSATNPLLHSRRCYISFIYNYINNEKQKPSEKEIVEAWNARPSNWINNKDYPFNEQGFVNGDRVLIEKRHQVIYDIIIGEKEVVEPILRYAKF